MASIKETFPIIMNGTSLTFFPTSWQRTPQKLQNVNQSEGGRDIVQNIRINKMNISASFVIADYDWVQFFETLNELDSFVLKEYEPKTNAYGERTVRMTDFSDVMRRKSEEIDGVNGVWEISFSLEEF